jgi:hypothetical protein
MIDNIIIDQASNTALVAQLKSAFGLPNVTYSDDFATVVAYGIDSWQGKNWDPALNDPSFDLYCGNVTSHAFIYPETLALKDTVHALLKAGGYHGSQHSLTRPILNWIGWLNDYAVSSCTDPDQDSCFSTHDVTYYEQDSLAADWRSWPYQYCTQWGFLQTGSGAPASILPLTSRTNTLEYESLVCKYAFNITTPPDVNAINKHGGFDISYPRLAIVDGEHDPWRPATPHASPFNSTAVNRTSTADEPFILIAGAVHHWDENGLFPNETIKTLPNPLPPSPVARTQMMELQFLQIWMEEWAQHQAKLKTQK